MGDELLRYYEEELAFVRREAADFADAHPKIAGRLRLGPGEIEDPHVARLIEAFAYLTARIRRKLDDEFPELTDAMLGVLYPHYEAPVPSLAIVQLETVAGLSAPYTVHKDAELESQPVDGEPCRFRTCYPVTLWPIRVESAAFAGSMVGAPAVSMGRNVASVLRLDLACIAHDMKLSSLAPESLRFYLRGQVQHVFNLYERLHNDLLEVVVVGDNGAKTALGPDAVKPVGFEAAEGLLPYPPQAFMGYRLLSEFFAFPQKFLFMDLTGLVQALRDAGNRAQIYFYLRRGAPELEQQVSAESFVLGCTPIVNLHRRHTEPIQLDQTQAEYRVVPDARRPNAFEVYHIDDVVGVKPNGQSAPLKPFYGIDHAATAEGADAFWKATRRPAPSGNSGSEIYLSLVDLALDLQAPADGLVNVDATCLNRDLPNKLPFGGGQPSLGFSNEASAVHRVVCLSAPTPTLRPPTRQGAMWRLVSHLTLNHLSIDNNEQGAKALREILALYDLRDSAETRAMIEGIASVRCRPTTARVRTPGHRPSLTRGVEVCIEFDETNFAGSGVFLFACVLERFLSLYCNVNSFTRLVAKLTGREEELRRWQPRAGDRTLL